jgi:hypothetical protein
MIHAKVLSRFLSVEVMAQYRDVGSEYQAGEVPQDRGLNGDKISQPETPNMITVEPSWGSWNS